MAPRAGRSARTALPERRRGWWPVPSLRLQLVLIPAAILLLALATAIGATLIRAQGRIEDEVRSSMELGQHLVAALVDRAGSRQELDASRDMLEEQLGHIRHVRILVRSVAELIGSDAMPADRQSGGDVPGWFVELLRPEPRISRHAITVDGALYGYTFMISNPRDEIGEIWDDLVFLGLLLSGLTLLIILILILVTRRALQPLQLLGTGFDALEQGRFDARLPPIAVPELTRIGEQFNSLGHRLRRSSDDNHLLIDRLMSLQEEERKTLARELHDAFGPALFAIRTDVAALARLASAGPGRVDEMVGLTRSVDGIVEDLQQTNYRLLEQLRPIVLDELGLAEALQQLVERHRHRFPRLRWSFELAPDAVMPAEPMALSLYRIVQECLTNAVRHAHARHVALLLAAAPEAAQAGGIRNWLRITVADDGEGVPGGFRMGFGLLGLHERIRRLDGRISLRQGSPRGTVIELAVPVPLVWSRP